MIARLWRHHRDDDGSILIALFALLVVTGILTAGLVGIVAAHTAARHDAAFEAALTGAEEGMSELIAQVRLDPTAASFAPVTGTNASNVSYTATATFAGGQWLVDATGTAPKAQGGTVQRHIQATVHVDDLLSVPLFGDSSLNLGGTAGGGSAVDRYDSGAGASASYVCDGQGHRVSMATGVDTRMCSQANPALGSLATNGGLTMRSEDLNDVSRADIFNIPTPGYPDPSATGECVGDGGVCASIGSQVFTHETKLSYPTSTMCSQGIGGGVTAYDGSVALAANTVYHFSDVTLNATAVANLANLSGSQIIICFSGTVVVPPLIGINSTPDPTQPLLYSNPRPPSTLLLISTDPGSAGTPAVHFGAGLGETSISAVVYAPTADCSADGHVDVYGMLVCRSIDAPSGLDVHYDNQVALMSTFNRPVTVSHWREVH